MKYLVNSQEMQECDKYTSEYFKVPSLLLMEQAALAACEEIIKIANKTEPILIVCGTGNNGGDGLAVGRILFLKGYAVELVLIGDEKKATEQNQKQQEILEAYRVPILKEIPSNETYQIVIDAIFGVGLTREITGSYKSVILKMNSLSGYKIALDIPSGVSADNGAVLGIAFWADVTITFAFAKVGLYLWPGNKMSGKIITKEIGITEHSFVDRRYVGSGPVMALEESDLKLLKERPSHSNKGTFGKLLLVAGSKNMAGAAILAGKSAYASGCGLVRILTPEENRVIIQTALPEAILTTYDPWNLDIELIKEAIDWANAIVIGPGIGTSRAAETILDMVLRLSGNVPLVLDADALNLIAKDLRKLRNLSPQRTLQEGGVMPLIITPHLGEMSRLTGKSIPEIQNNLLETATEFMKKYNVICVLKDERTITCMDKKYQYPPRFGTLCFLNLSGNAGMATAGSGDVLSGILGSFTAQRYHMNDAVPLAVYLHGLAGDYMIKETGKEGLMATDLIEGIRRILGCKERKDRIL